MPSLNINQFYKGIQEDDIISSETGIIDMKNTTGLRTGYGITLGPKSNKQISVGDTEIYNFLYYNSSNFYGVGHNGTNGYAYKLNGTDDTPHCTLTTSETLYPGLCNMIRFGNNYHFIATTSGYSGSYAVHYIDITDFNAGTFTSFNYDLTDAGVSNSNIPVIYKTSSYYLILGENSIVSVANTSDTDDTPLATIYNIFSGNLVGITRHGTTYYTYSDNGTCQLWNGIGSDSIQGSIPLGFIPKKIHTIGNIDYVISEDGELYIGSGYDLQKYTTPRQSNRLEDNSSYSNILNFDNDLYFGNTMAGINSNIYTILNDGVYGIAEYGQLISQLNKYPHKILCTNYNGDDLDKIFGLYYHNRSSEKKLYYSYKQGDNYIIDYVDITSMETSKNGYFITQIFRGPPEKIFSIENIRVTSSNTSGNNYIKLYYRINNGDWTIFRTINSTDNTIIRDKITSIDGGESFPNVTDIQFKVEYYNDTQGEDAPIIHGIELNYNVTQD